MNSKQNFNKHETFFNKHESEYVEAMGMTLWLRTFAALPEDSNPVPSTQRQTVHSYL